MALDKRIKIHCDYCDEKFTLRFNSEDVKSNPEYCCFCGETFEDPSKHVDEDDVEHDYDHHHDHPYHEEFH